MGRDLVGLFVADPGVEPAPVLAGIDHAVPVGAGRRVGPDRDRRRTFLDGDIRPEEPQRVGVHGEPIPAALLEDPREPPDDGAAAPRDLPVLVLDFGVRGEQGTECLRVLFVVGLDERGDQLGDGPDVSLPLP